MPASRSAAPTSRSSAVLQRLVRCSWSRFALLALVAFGCAHPPALVPYDTVADDFRSGPNTPGMNHNGVERYRSRDFQSATSAFQQAVAIEPDPRFFFNLCLSLTEEHRLDEACQACVAVPRHILEGDRLRDRILDQARRQLARIDALAKQRGTRLTCSPVLPP